MRLARRRRRGGDAAARTVFNSLRDGYNHACKVPDEPLFQTSHLLLKSALRRTKTHLPLAFGEDGMSAFRYALRCDHLRVVVVLLRAGVQPMFPETDADPHRLGYNAAALALARSVRRAGS